MNKKTIRSFIWDNANKEIDFKDLKIGGYYKINNSCIGRFIGFDYGSLIFQLSNSIEKLSINNLFMGVV